MKHPHSKVQMTVCIDRELAEWARRKAAVSGRSISQVMDTAAFVGRMLDRGELVGNGKAVLPGGSLRPARLRLVL